jgi:MFS family permease
MQVVGAQWLMGSLSDDPLQVALIQTAVTLPALVVGLPAGAVGDILDRRRLLLATQTFMLAAAALLAALTAAGLATPWVLLALIFAIGLGQALTAPSWQALQPELVSRAEIPQAAALGSVSMNMARAVGPALGGALVATAGPAAVFAINAASFLGILGVLAWWRRPTEERALGAEHFRAAVRAGIRYARSSPRLRNVLVRLGLFAVFASGLWALLPVVAREGLGLGAGGYGLLLGGVGVGAILGAFVLPPARGLLSVNQLVAVASLAFALGCLCLAWLPSLPLVAAALILVGMAWITVLASLNGSAQNVLPAWVRSRGMALYQLVLQGGQALGAVAWGLLAQRSDARVAFAVIAGGLATGVVGAWRWPLRPLGDLDLRLYSAGDPPFVALDPRPDAGPVLVTVEYRVRLEDQEAFKAAMHRVGRTRRRTGAERWGLFQDGTDPEILLETFLVPTWEEHLRQHLERTTVADRLYAEQARSYQVEGTEPRVRHLFFAYD